jgi:hypothetical protein
MTLQEAVVAKLQHLPEGKQEEVLLLLDEWIERYHKAKIEETRNAVAIVQQTWANLTLNQETLRWVAKDKELEYDLG